MSVSTRRSVVTPGARPRVFTPRVRLGVLAFVLALGCGEARGRLRAPERYDADRLQAALASTDPAPGLLLGEYPLTGVIDGDTIKVAGLPASLRLLALDAEETFKSKKDLQLYENLGFERYLEAKGGGGDRPVKCATPLGMVAKDFAEKFFQGVRTVRLERDHPKKIRDAYERLLAYVFVEKDGVWVNYNVEAVRAGMSPYFTKYGYSERFHDEFVRAQDEARAAERGIWSADGEHYHDYDLRLAWWNARAEFIRTFEDEAATRDDLIVLTHWDAPTRMAAREGQEVELLGSVGNIRRGRDGAPTRVMLTRRMFSDVPLVFFDEDVYAASRIEDARGELARVRGTVSTYRYRSKTSGQGARTQLQIQIKLPQQVRGSDTAPSRFQASGDATLGAPVPPPRGGVPRPSTVSEPVPTSRERVDAPAIPPALPEPDDTLPSIVPPPPPPPPPPEPRRSP